MSALEQPRMVWLECGHERITLTRVYAGRRLPCFNPACKIKGRSQMRTITAVGTINGYSLYELPIEDERPSLLRRMIEALR